MKILYLCIHICLGFFKFLIAKNERMSLCILDHSSESVWHPPPSNLGIKMRSGPILPLNSLQVALRNVESQLKLCL